MRLRRVYVVFSLLWIAGFCVGQNSSTLATTLCATAEQRQLDFWVGEWDLTWPGNNPGEVQHGTNSIRRVLENCVVEENFSGGSDMHLRGKSVSLFDTRAGKWKQTWVDNEGGYLDFVGEFKDGQMILDAKRRGRMARGPCREWSSRTSARMNSIGVGRRRKTAAKPGRCNGQSTTSGASSLYSISCQSEASVT